MFFIKTLVYKYKLIALLLYLLKDLIISTLNALLVFFNPYIIAFLIFSINLISLKYLDINKNSLLFEFIILINNNYISVKEI